MTKPRINLALQGGGAHGAFTWGVLDKLLEADVFEIAAISGTSAGALNGAALKAGFAKRGGGIQAARDNLDWLWEQVGAVNDPTLLPWLTAYSPALVSKSIELSLPFAISDSVSRMISPYDSGPFYKNALENIVSRFHYDAVCASLGPELHICATNVRSGKIRVFTGGEIGPDPIMASGRMEAYWDGGFTGNPALFPMFRSHLPQDVVIVNINPLHREELPVTARDIQNRINEISFNSSLLRELRAIHYVKELLADGSIAPRSKKDVIVQMISDEDLMTQLSVATKLNPNASVLAQLKQAGHAAAEAFLDVHESDIGKRSSVDLEKMFG